MHAYRSEYSADASAGDIRARTRWLYFGDASTIPADQYTGAAIFVEYVIYLRYEYTPVLYTLDTIFLIMVPVQVI